MNTASTDLLDHLEQLDRHAATDLIRSELDQGRPASSVITELLAPAQRQVGERWHQGEWTVTQEHAATGIIDDLLGLLAAHTPRPTHGSVALVCAEGDWHVTPARMAALIWRSAGWDVTYLGGSTPPDHLRTSIELLRPDVVALSCTLPLALPGAGRVAAALEHLEIPILAGGRAYGPDRRRSNALGIHGWAPDALQAMAIFEGWLDAPPDRPVPIASDGEELSLELAIPDLVTAADLELADRFPQMRSYDLQQRTRTREDLDYILRFAVVTLTVDDPRIFHDFLDWLTQLLTTRHVPAAALVSGLEALTDALTDLPRTVRLLSNGIDRLQQETSSIQRAP